MASRVPVDLDVFLGGKTPGQNAKPIYIGPKRGCFYHFFLHLKFDPVMFFFLNVHVYYMQVNEMCIGTCICRYV